MADPSLNPTPMALGDLMSQNITITGPDGFPIDISLAEVDANSQYIVANTIGYSVEFGASLVMLGVLFAMTPRSKFWRLASYINVAALFNNLVRTILLAVYFESSWMRFYVLYSGDNTPVTDGDFRNSVCSVVFSIPQNFLMMAALMLQAWAMVKLWPNIYKWGILAFSGVLSLAEVAFMLVAQADQIRSIYPGYDHYEYLTHRLWVRYLWLALELASVCWFCFMFILRLVTHMWTNRSFLPSTNGLAAMDVLVMTNGVLMLIPGRPFRLLHHVRDFTDKRACMTVVLVGLQMSQKLNFETGSLVYTSVIIVLPLGTLVSQRVADPGAFNSEGSRGSTASAGNALDRYSASALAEKPLLPGWSQCDNTTTIYSDHGCSNSGAGKTGVTSAISSERFAKRGSDAVDLELARIDCDLEMGRVRVNRELQRSEEVL